MAEFKGEVPVFLTQGRYLYSDITLKKADDYLGKLKSKKKTPEKHQGLI